MQIYLITFHALFRSCIGARLKYYIFRRNKKKTEKNKAKYISQILQYYDRSLEYTNKA